MDKNLIREFTMRDSRYSFTLCNGYYHIPSYIQISSGDYLDIKDSIRKSKRKGNSRYVRTFKRDLGDIVGTVKNRNQIYFEYVQEFPIPIEDLDLWVNLLYKEGLNPNNHSEFFERKFFLLDFFFYYPGFIVEIDSDYHNPQERKRYDSARDKYISKKYGLETYRINKYGDSVVSDKYSIEYIRDVIIEKTAKNYNYNLSYYDIDFSKTIVGNYVKNNKGALEFIDKLKNYLQELFEYSIIVITRADLGRIDPYNFVTGLRKDQEKLFIDTVTIVLREVYKKELFIQDTEEYSIGDVLRVMELINTKMFTWADFEGRKIKRWLIDLIGFPPPEYIGSSTSGNLRITLPSESDDGGDIKGFIELLVRAKILTSGKDQNSYI